jgi:hypothetical protein
MSFRSTTTKNQITAEVINCNNLDDFVAIQKKLQPSWSSWSVCRLFTPSLLEDLSSNFHALEKKVKMKLLISLIGLDLKKRQEYSKQIKHLLRIAYESSESSDAESWVAVTAGLVSERLFGDDTVLDANSISHAAKDSLTNLVDQLMEQYMRQVGVEARAEAEAEVEVPLDSSRCRSDDLRQSENLTDEDMPLDSFYMRQQGNSHPSRGHSNPYFTFTGTAPAILERELARQAKRAATAQNSGTSLLGNMNSQSEDRERAKANAAAAAAKTQVTSTVAKPLPSFLLQAKAPRASVVQMMSLDDLKGLSSGLSSGKTGAKDKSKGKDKEKAKEAEKEKEKEKEKAKEKEKEKGHIPINNIDVGGGLEAAHGTGDNGMHIDAEMPDESATAVSSGSSDGASAQKKRKLEQVGHMVPETGASPHNASVGGDGSIASAMPIEASEQVQEQEQIPVRLDAGSTGVKDGWELPRDLLKLFAASPKLSAEDRSLIEQFFLPHGDSKSTFLEEAVAVTPVSGEPTATERRVLLSEAEVVDKETGKITGKIVRYIVLNTATKDWVLSDKYKAKKAK